MDFWSGIPSYGVKPEPQVEIDEVVFDRGGFPWWKSENGWVAGGDTREQPWDGVAKWF